MGSGDQSPGIARLWGVMEGCVRDGTDCDGGTQAARLQIASSSPEMDELFGSLAVR